MENNQKAFNLPFSENLPIILIGNLSVEPLRAAGIIEEALTLVEDKLTEFIASPTLATDLQTVFGQSTNVQEARTLLDGLPVSDELPQITLVSAELMNGAVGGFDSLTGTVYLADSLIDPNSVITSDTEPSPHLVNVIIEELGHWLDSRLNQVDTPGDEGEWLAALVQGDGLSASEIARLRSETDQVVVTLEDQTVILEASGPSFTEDTSISLAGVVQSSVAWADYNGDGKPDFLLTGLDNSDNYISKLYKNTGSGFTEDTTISLPGVGGSSVAWADYNGDGKPDFLLTGFGSFGRISKLYKNTGSGFTEDTSVSLPGVYWGSVAWADYNGDGKPDFLLTGYDGNSYNEISKLYKNTGSGFTEDTTISLPGVWASSVAWADYNGDGKPDLLLTGEDGLYSYNRISKLYKNTGNGFTEDTSVSLPGVYWSSVAWADYNGDGKQDFLLTGWDNSDNKISKLYKNTGNGFTEDTSVFLPGVGDSSLAWADYNGDGKQDFLLTGGDNSGYRISKLYKNTGSGFSEDTSISLPGVAWGSVAWADYNGDGKQYFLLTGWDNSSSSISKLYKNTTSTSAKISIKDTQIIEGDNGKKLAKFTVSLNTKVNQKVEVSYATTNGTAKAGEDYQRTNGKLTFKPGETRKTINVPVFGDTKLEGNETFKLLLSQPQNAQLGKKQAIGSISNDDLAKLTVSLNTKVNQKVEVSYATSDGTAKLGEDYQRTNGKLTFKPNQTQKTIIVPILGDTLDEDNETFFLNLSQPKNADLGDKRAIGKITDNDMGGDKSGDSFKTAVNLGKVKQEISRNDQIGFTEGVIRDTDDYYRLQLDRKGTLFLTLQGLSKDADINLYGSEQELMTQGINDGTNPEIIEQQLDPGIYYVKVYPKVKTYTNYRLNVDFS
ncbi:FG-GAP repeat domain-containing protein [Planktothrix agardhii]|uniref:FG-GAP repeat domain-containing protein n=1 Tax=Planktothrix agardhii TaxID=1160 RepID=UPI001F1D8D5C|nr:VCBS repeat-containing protein [Planktothrix agardhii]MCF3586289.1 FG-GAP-like repeat-containing protein [Planktothrix agardhii 1803]MCF3603152.1 FG-GAP-like repeat-containing protein [Planktothrix agardhii 1804]